MTVYVDDAYIETDDGRQWCHLVADTFSELEAFARKIGLAESWLHNGNHYDVTNWMRNEAVKAGAKQVSQNYAAIIRRNMMRKRQGKEPLPLPEN